MYAYLKITALVLNLFIVENISQTLTTKQLIVPGLPPFNNITTKIPNKDETSSKKPILLDNYIPAAMQCLAYYIEMLQYEQVDMTTLEPPLNAEELQTTTPYIPPSTTPLSYRGESTKFTSAYWSTTVRPSTSTIIWWKPSSTISTTTPKSSSTVWWQSPTKTTTTVSTTTPRSSSTVWWQSPTKTTTTIWWPPKTTTTTKKSTIWWSPPSTTKRTTINWWQQSPTTTLRPITTTSWWQDETTNTISSSKKPSTVWWSPPSTTKRSSTVWWSSSSKITTKSPAWTTTKSPTWTTTKSPTRTTTKSSSWATTKPPSKTTTTIWWYGPTIGATKPTKSNQTTKKPASSQMDPYSTITTPFHKPGIYAPNAFQIKPQSTSTVINNNNLDNTYEISTSFPLISSNDQFMEWFLTGKAKQLKEEDNEYDFDLLDPLPKSLIYDILAERPQQSSFRDNDIVNEFLRVYDDSYGRAQQSSTGKKKVPITKPYVEFLLLYDMLKRESKFFQFNKYEGYTPRMLMELAETSNRSAERQLHTVLSRILIRNELSRTDLINRIKLIIKDLENPQSTTSKALRYIPPLKFVL